MRGATQPPNQGPWVQAGGPDLPSPPRSLAPILSQALGKQTVRLRVEKTLGTGPGAPSSVPRGCNMRRRCPSMAISSFILAPGGAAHAKVVVSTNWPFAFHHMGSKSKASDSLLGPRGAGVPTLVEAGRGLCKRHKSTLCV